MNPRLFAASEPVFIQGMTGKEGVRMSDWMIGEGTNVVAGITPGKGGQVVAGRPIFSSVAEAKAAFPVCTISSIVVPAPHVRSAAMEALDAGITFLHILTEQVPVHDVLALRSRAKEVGAVILGPSSVGYLQFPRFRIGYLGGQHPFAKLKEGSMAVISSSGGMTNEIIMSLDRAGVGVRVAIAVGGDRIPGMTSEEALRWCEALDEVKSVGLFVEPGNALLKLLTTGEVTPKKPTALVIPGIALGSMPKGVPYGHTGTIVDDEGMSLQDLQVAIRNRGIACELSLNQFIAQCTSLCPNP